MTDLKTTRSPHTTWAAVTFLVCGALKVVAAAGYVVSALRAPPGMFRGFGVVGAVVLAAPVLLYGALDLAAGSALRGRSAAGAVLGAISAGLGTLLHLALALLGVLALSQGQGVDGPRWLAINLLLPAAALGVNAALLVAVLRARRPAA